MLYNGIYGNMYWIDIEYTNKKCSHWQESKILRISSIIRLILLGFNISLDFGSVNNSHHHLLLLLQSLTWILCFCRLNWVYQVDVSVCSIINPISTFYFPFLSISYKHSQGNKTWIIIQNNLSFYDKWLLHLFHTFSLLWKYTV